MLFPAVITQIHVVRIIIFPVNYICILIVAHEINRNIRRCRTLGRSITIASNDLSTASDAQAALTNINSAIAGIAGLRGSLGASSNQLSAASNVMDSQITNLSSAEDKIMAADMGTATANLSQESILQQTGIAALQKSQQMQQSVLKLLQ